MHIYAIQVKSAFDGKPFIEPLFEENDKFENAVPVLAPIGRNSNPNESFFAYYFHYWERSIRSWRKFGTSFQQTQHMTALQKMAETLVFPDSKTSDSAKTQAQQQFREYLIKRDLHPDNFKLVEIDFKHHNWQQAKAAGLSEKAATALALGEAERITAYLIHYQYHHPSLSDELNRIIQAKNQPTRFQTLYNLFQLTDSYLEKGLHDYLKSNDYLNSEFALTGKTNPQTQVNTAIEPSPRTFLSLEQGRFTEQQTRTMLSGSRSNETYLNLKLLLSKA